MSEAAVRAGDKMMAGKRESSVATSFSTKELRFPSAYDFHPPHLHTHFTLKRKSPKMTAQAPVNTSEQRKATSVPWQDFEATLLESLEISSWDLAVLEHHLVAAKWVPSSTEEDAVKEAVFKFRQSYESAAVDYASIFSDNQRLIRLFDIWTDKEVEESEIDHANDYMTPEEKFKLIVKRETAKYNAVRSLIAHLAADKNPTGPTGSMIHLTNEQATELLNSNACMRAIYFNNVKKLVEHETKNLKQTISKKDAEIAGMLRSLA